MDTGTSKRYDMVLEKAIRDRLSTYSEKSGLKRASIIKAAIDDYLRARGH